MQIPSFTAYFVKPIEITHLLEIIGAYLPTPFSTPEQVGESRHILIADDNPAQLELLQLQLSQAGFVVTTASNGEEALQKIKTNPPDAVISDVLMPKLDGFELCLKIRHDPALRHIPVILLTPNDLEGPDRELAEKVAATAYVSRSSNATKITALIVDGLKTKKTEKKPQEIDLFKEEHTHRLIRQLESQAIVNEGLAERCVLQAAQLSLLGGMANLATTDDIENTVQNVLSICLDAAGISKGALYLSEQDKNIKLRQIIGFNDTDTTLLMNFLAETELLAKVCHTQQVIQLPSNETPKEMTKTFLQKVDISTALLTPLISGSHCLGVLLLGFQTMNSGKDSIAFVHALGAQLGQSLELAIALKSIVASEQRHRILMDNASCGIFISNPQGKIIEVNKQGEQLLNCARDKILGKDFQEFIYETDRSYTNTQLQKIFQEGTIGLAEIRVQPHIGEARIVEFSGVIVKTGGESLLLMVTTDITERTHLRDQALLNDRLASVGTLATGIAHEINNPIAWVLANLSFLKSHAAKMEEHIQKMSPLEQEDLTSKKLQQVVTNFSEVIEESIQGAEKIRDIVRDLKGFSRIDEEEISAIDINEILNTAINMAAPEYKYRAQLEKNFAQNLPKTMANGGKLHQVFLNLIINAAQAIPEGNAKNNKIKISTQRENSNIRVQIDDTGLGIPSETLPRVFDPFFTTKPVGQGTGLGLSICYEIIHHMGGEISVHSTLKKGTTFLVDVPIKLPSDQPQPKQQQEPTVIDITRKKILIIDDEPYLLKSLQRMLNDSHDVTTAVGGRTAIELLSQKEMNFDIVISDLTMPDIDGVDLYHYIKKENPRLVPHIIFMTGGAYNLAKKEFLANVGNPYLEKPFTQEELLQMIEKISQETH